MLQKEENEEEEKEKASKAGTTGGSSGAATKANIAIAEDDQIVLLDPSSPPVPERIGHSWMAIAEDDLIQLINVPTPENADHNLPLDDLSVSGLNHLPPADHLHANGESMHRGC